jgi:hypothetical protein
MANNTDWEEIPVKKQSDSEWEEVKPSKQPSLNKYLKDLSPKYQKMLGEVDKAVSPEGISRVAAAGLLPGSSAAATAGMTGLKGLLARSAVAGMQSGATSVANLDPDTDAKTKAIEFAKAAPVGVLSQAGGEALSGVGRAITRPFQTAKLALNPVKAQDTASEAIESATEKLRSSQAEKLGQQLSGKQLGVDTTQLKGISPEIDNILSKYQSPYGDLQSRINLDAQDANTIRSLIDQQTSFKKLGPFARSAEAAASDISLNAKANELRKGLHGLGSDVSQTYDDWAAMLNQAKSLEASGNRSPISTLATSSPDKSALLQRVDQEIGSNLSGLGNQLKASQDLSWKNPVPLFTEAGAGLKEGITKAGGQTAPVINQGLFNLIEELKKSKKE